MLQSQFCILDNLSEKDMYELNECPYDKGGYFVINGSEKVLIAQERMATNRVYVFAKSQPSPVSYLAEIRSAVEKGGKTISSMQIKMMRRTERQVTLSLSLSYPWRRTVDVNLSVSQSGQTIKSSIPYIRADIPIVVVFRALDIIPDRDILDHICYDKNDAELFEMMKPCLEDAFPIQSRDVSITPTSSLLHRRVEFVIIMLNAFFELPSFPFLSFLYTSFNYTIPRFELVRNRSLSTLSVEEEPLPPFLEIDESTTPLRSFKRRCYLTFRWLKVKTRRRLSSLVTWCIDYSWRRWDEESWTIEITLVRNGWIWLDLCWRRCSGCYSGS